LHSISLTLPFSHESPREARRIVDRLPLEEASEAQFNLRLLVTELVTNAVLHAKQGMSGVITVAISIAAGKVRVEVANPGSGFAVPHQGGMPRNTIGGRGLRLVEALADRWDACHDAEASQTVVWFEIDL
jgi:anti-sigma regulatory factor (Ser/Thr protein kinase)